jgi:hypothetical protein
VLVGLVPAVLVIAWLLFAPFEAQVQEPARLGDCGPTVVAAFRPPADDGLRFACGEAADDRMVAAGVVAVGAGAWLLLAPKVLRRRGRGAAVFLWVALAGGVVLLAPFTAEGDGYDVGGTTWDRPMSCPAPLVALRYADFDGGQQSCADPAGFIRFGAAVAAIGIGTIGLLLTRRSPEQEGPSTADRPVAE